MPGVARNRDALGRFIKFPLGPCYVCARVGRLDNSCMCKRCRRSLSVHAERPVATPSPFPVVFCMDPSTKVLSRVEEGSWVEWDRHFHGVHGKPVALPNDTLECLSRTPAE